MEQYSMQPILRELVQSALGCYNFGAYHASFILASCAVDATAKRRFPDERSVGKRVKAFLRAHMPEVCGAAEYWVAVDMPSDKDSIPLNVDGIPDLPKVGDDFYQGVGTPRMVLMEGVVYHAFRCALSHEAQLQEVELLPPMGDRLRVQVDSKVRISADLIGRLLHVVVNAPENCDTFPDIRDRADSSPGR